MVYIISDVKKSLGLEWVISMLIEIFFKTNFINCENSSLKFWQTKKFHI